LIKIRYQGSSAVIETYKTILNDHSLRAILILRIIPRMRMYAPSLAGSMRLSFRIFLLFDLLALTAFTGIYLLLGIIFNLSLPAVIAKTKGLQNIVFFAAVLIIGVALLLFIRKRRKDKKENEKIAG